MLTVLLNLLPSTPQGDILEDIQLIENLEETKRTAMDIEDKVKQAKITEVSISKAREVYRPVASRGSQVYFLIDNLNALDRCVRGIMKDTRFMLVGRCSRFAVLHVNSPEQVQISCAMTFAVHHQQLLCTCCTFVLRTKI